ncbi:MAG TPA: TIGR03009 domain-containing protein [Pirellulales bacterium]|nr:TIGR03009 domain-containing protein [Pirellulales bacterium]
MSLVRRLWLGAHFLGLAVVLTGWPAGRLAAQQAPARTPAKRPNDAAPDRPAAQGAKPQPQAQRNAGPIRFGGVPQRRKPVDPFALTPEQQAVVDLVLRKWEEKQKKIKTFSCEFTLFEYDGTYEKARESNGKVYYAAPDKGKYEVFDEEGAPGEHWVCDGKSIYEFNKDAKKLIERPLPEEMRGKAIVDSPLPFVFGSSADKMAQRYWMRVTSAAEDPRTLEKGEFLLEAIPKFQRDAGNFQKVEIIFSERDMLPLGLNQFLPAHTNQKQSRKAYQFRKQKVDGFIDKVSSFISKPRTPLGWTYVVENPNDAGPDVAPPKLQMEGALRPTKKKTSAR